MDGDQAYCNNVQELKEELQHERSSGQFSSFVDWSKVSLKAVLLCNRKKVPSMPVARAVHMQEMYENLQVWLQEMHYEEHQWKICADLNVAAIQTVLQGRYTKFCGF